jgi:hypothetical protein
MCITMDNKRKRPRRVTSTLVRLSVLDPSEVFEDCADAMNDAGNRVSNSWNAIPTPEDKGQKQLL